MMRYSHFLADEFFTYAGISMDDVVNNISNQTETATEIITCLAEYGVYDVLVPIIEIIHVFCSEKETKWIDDLVKTFPYHEFINMSVDNYHNILEKRFRRRYGISIKDSTENRSKAFEISIYDKEEYIWNSYDIEQLSIICDSNKQNVGLWIPGFYSNEAESKYIEHVKDAIQGLEKTIDYKRGKPNNIFLSAIIKRQINLLITNITNAYRSILSSTEHSFYKTDIKELRCKSIAELKDLLLQTDTKKIYVEYDVEWVRAIEKLIKLSIEFFDRRHFLRLKQLESFIPLLYQCIDEDIEAENVLINSILPRGNYTTSGTIISCSIALLKSQNKYNISKIRSFIESTYIVKSNKGWKERYISVVDQIIQWVSCYLKRIEQCVEGLDKNVKIFYENMMRESINSGEEIHDECSLLWIYEYMIKDNKLIHMLTKCRDIIKPEGKEFIDIYHIVYELSTLIDSFSVHLDASPRINLREYIVAMNDCATITDANMQNELIFLMEDLYIKTNEIMHYSRLYDGETHKILISNLNNVMAELPDYRELKWIIHLLKYIGSESELIYDTIYAACGMISSNIKSYAGFNENAFNREIRNLLIIGLSRDGYAICDQSQQGYGETGNEPGSLDILIQKEGISLVIFEALCRVSDVYLRGHIDKAIHRYNIFGCRRIYIVEYCRQSSFDKYWDNTLRVLHNYPGLQLSEKESKYMGVRICEGTFAWKDRTGDMVFIGVNCKY